MFRTKKTVILSIALAISFLLAFIFFALQKEWILWRGPLETSDHYKKQHTYKEIELLYWQHEQLKHETITQVWGEDEQQNINYLINTWLTFLYEEKCISHKVCVQATMLNPSKTELFISFDHKPYNNKQSILEKVRFIQTLLKTIAPCTTAQSVHFLVNHKPLVDQHLDFDSDWTITTD